MRQIHHFSKTPNSWSSWKTFTSVISWKTSVRTLNCWCMIGRTAVTLSLLSRILNELASATKQSVKWNDLTNLFATDFDSYEKEDSKIKEWRFLRIEADWNEARMKYTWERSRTLGRVQLPLFHCPDLTIDADDIYERIKAYENVRNNHLISKNDLISKIFIYSFRRREANMHTATILRWVIKVCITYLIQFKQFANKFTFFPDILTKTKFVNHPSSKSYSN